MISVVAVKLPSVDITVIAAGPAPTAVTNPLSATLAMPSSLLLQVTPKSVAFTGLTVAVKLVLAPISIISVKEVIVIPVTGTTIETAFTVQIKLVTTL